MSGKTEDRVIRDHRGKTVAVMQIRDSLLDGKCEWYDGKGGLIACGFFKDGKPWAGTFLNWTLFMPEQDRAQPYDLVTHCKDWVSVFEASFDSEPPQYRKLIEVHSNGERICEEKV